VVAHEAYQRDIAKVPQGSIPPLVTEDTPEGEVTSIIAQNLAPLYALDGAMTELWRGEKHPPIEALRGYLLSDNHPLGLTLSGIFANTGWKAGQPFRGIERIEREVFKPAVFLDKDEIDKDHILTGAVAQHLLGKVRDKLENIYPEKEQQELLSRIDSVLEAVSQNVSSAGEKLTDGQIDAMRKTARETMYAHRHQRRKSGEPYFHHQLDVVEALVTVFKVDDPRLVHVAFRHDTREDQLLHYENQQNYRLNKLSRNEATPGGDPSDAERKREDLWHEALAVRMLSKLEGEKYGHLSPEDRLRDTYEQLCNPRDHYDNPNLPHYSDEWIRGVQKVKMADILANLGDLSALLEPHGSFIPGERDVEFPERFTRKILDYAIPGLVNRSTYLTDEDREIFFNHAEQVLSAYLALPLNEHTAPFRGALQGKTGLISELKQLSLS